MKIRFTIKERLAIQEILPKSGGITKMIIIRELITKTALTGEDIKTVGMKDNPDGTTSWDPSKDPNKEYDFTESELSILKESAKQIDKEEKITLGNLSLIEKIINA